MSSSPHRFNTAPARLGGRSSLKRASDGMTVWQLQEAMGTLNDAPVLATRVDSYRSNASSEHSDYGSWPRVRKQRTQEIMSLSELTAAFEQSEPVESPGASTVVTAVPSFPEAAPPSLSHSVSVLDATTSALTDDAAVEQQAFEGLDWEALAGDAAQATVDWTGMAGDVAGPHASAEQSVLDEATAELISQANSLRAAAPAAAASSLPADTDTDLDASELLTMLGADDMATGDFMAAHSLSQPPSQPPSRPKSPDTALAMHMGGLGVGPAALMPTPPMSAAAPSRSAERKEWTAAEDVLIRSGVEVYGCKWRKIAAQLPGRSDDAVRNRWHRLQAAAGELDENHACMMAPTSHGGVAVPRRRSGAAGGRQAAAAAAAAAEGVSPPRGKPERLSWTPMEDQIIIASVDELGHKWYKIAQRLPGRTEHAIRNRYHRVLTAMNEQQRRQQPSPPAPPASLFDAPLCPMELSAAMLVGA